MLLFGDKSETKEQRRNRAYLKLIFDHPQEVIEKVLHKYSGLYPQCYDALVILQGHGTPGRPRARARSIAPEILLIEPLGRAGNRLRQGSNRRFSDAIEEYEMQKERRLKQAASFVERFEKRTCSVKEFWIGEWGRTYEGFLQVQRELGVLRDELSDRRRYTERDEYRVSYSLASLRKSLSFMLRSSAGEWFKKWGELDLHRLSERDALVSILALMKQPWSEMRIVAGQKRHVGEDHVSEGVLHDMIHRLFDDLGTGGWGGGGGGVGMGGSEEDGLYDEIRRYVDRWDVEVEFYSNGAAVHLKKGVRVGRDVGLGWGAARGERVGRWNEVANWRQR